MICELMSSFRLLSMVLGLKWFKFELIDSKQHYCRFGLTNIIFEDYIDTVIILNLIGT